MSYPVANQPPPSFVPGKSPVPLYQTLPPQNPQLYLVPIPPSQDPAQRLQPLAGRIVQIRELLQKIVKHYDVASKPHQEALAKGFRRYYVIAAIQWIAEGILAIKAFPYVASAGSWFLYQFVNLTDLAPPLLATSPMWLLLLAGAAVGIGCFTLWPLQAKLEKEEFHKNSLSDLQHSKKYYTDLQETFSHINKTIGWIECKNQGIYDQNFARAMQQLSTSLNACKGSEQCRNEAWSHFNRHIVPPKDEDSLDALISELTQTTNALKC